MHRSREQYIAYCMRKNEMHDGTEMFKAKPNMGLIKWQNSPTIVKTSVDYSIWCCPVMHAYCK